MHHKIRPLRPAAVLIAALCSAGAQAANVNVYGLLDVFVASQKVSGGAERRVALESGGMTTSFWGIGGAEDLGDGLKAKFAIEGFMQVDTGASGRSPADTFFGRSAYVGLSGGFGELRVGRQGNPMFFATASFNPFFVSTRFSPMVNVLWTPPFGMLLASDTGWSNAVGYYSPQMAGFSGQLVYGFGETPGDSGVNNLGGLVMYQSGPLAAVVAAQDVEVGPGLSALRPRQKAYTAGVSYDAGWSKFFASYAQGRFSGDRQESKTWQLGSAVPVGTGKLLISAVTTTIDPEAGRDYRRRGFGFGYDYPLSVRTDVYANYLYDRLGSQGGASTIGAGIRHKF